MKANQSLQVWGIYHLDREYSHSLDDPLRTVVETRSKPAVGQETVRLGFGDGWAHQVTLDEVRKAQWLPKCLQRQPITQSHIGGFRRMICVGKARAIINWITARERQRMKAIDTVIRDDKKWDFTLDS